MDDECKKLNIKGFNTIKKINKDTTLERIKKYKIPDCVYSNSRKQHYLLCSLYVENKCTYMDEINKELKYKFRGYISQDKHHNIYDNDYFLTPQDILELLVKSKLKCHYCKCECYILYKEVRQKNQWTIDRIDNEQGHNKDNCVIACYACNVQKKTMNEKKFQFTKQMKIVKKE